MKLNCHCPAYSFPHRPASGSCCCGGVPYEWPLVKAWDTVFDNGSECCGCPRYSSDLGRRECTLPDKELRFCPGLTRTFVREQGSAAND